MGETMEAGGRDGGRGRVKDVTMLRIDHSDVYIENERLGEDLLHTIDTIHRRRYQKVMSRDTEINELKQSLAAMRQVGPRSPSGVKRPKGGASPQRSKPGNNNKDNYKTDINGNTKSKGIFKRKGKASDGDSSSTPSTLKSIEVRMPSTKPNGKHSYYDSDENSDDSESDLDSSDEDDSDDDDDNNDSVDNIKDIPKQNGLNRNNLNNRQMFMTSRNIPSASTVSTRNHSNDRNNNNERTNNNNKHRQIKRTDPLSRIMSRLNLDQLPPSWYTSVVPATDVHVTKRILGVDGIQNTSQQNGPGGRKSKSRKNHKKAIPQVRPSTTAGDIFRQDSKTPFQRTKSQIQLMDQNRPFTTAGVRTWGGDDDVQRSRSRMGGNKSVNNNNENERSQSVLFCEQAVHGTKTMRQLKEEEMQSAMLLHTYNPIDILLEEVKEEQKVIDEKVKKFVKSLDERKQSERLKKLKSEMNLI